MSDLSDAAENLNLLLHEHILTEVNRISELPQKEHHSQLLMLSSDVEDILLQAGSLYQSDVSRLVTEAYNTGGITVG